MFKAYEKHGHRTDYAIVQRFPVRRGAHEVAVLIVAGATSLGTVGAARWLTMRDGVHLDLYPQIKKSDRVEILLRVTAAVRSPARPWDVEECVEEKVLLKSGPNLLASPSVVTLGVSGPLARDIKYLLLDEEEMPLQSPAHGALAAICWHSHHRGTNVVDVDSLCGDGEAWPEGKCPIALAESANACTWIRDHLKSRLLKERLEVFSNPASLTLKFELKIHQL